MHSKIDNPKKYWMGLNVFMVASMVIIGGITRITNSGLSMTEWNLIGGIIPPINLQDWNLLFDKYKATPEYELRREITTGMSAPPIGMVRVIPINADKIMSP